MGKPRPINDLTAERWKNLKLGAENTRIQSACTDALTMLDAMHVCCRGHECERRAGRYNAEMDDSCRLHDVRETLARGVAGQPAATEK